MKFIKLGLLALLLSVSSVVFAAQDNIITAAEKNGDFKTLVQAIKIAGLTKTLEGTGPFTVFAPTDEAFAALPKETLDALLKNPAALAKVLEYHVIAGAVNSSDVKSGDVKTVEGEDIHFTVNSGVINVNDAKVVTADIKTDNGVIHAIDKVLIPQKK